MPQDKGCSFPKRLADKMTGNSFFARIKIWGGSLNLPPAHLNKYTNNGYQDTLSTKNRQIFTCHIYLVEKTYPLPTVLWFFVLYTGHSQLQITAIN